MPSDGRTPRQTLWTRPPDLARLKALRDQMQAHLPYGRLSLQDAFSIAVSSLGNAVEAGQAPQMPKPP